MNTENVAIFTPEMKKTHTILMPMMLPIHFGIMKYLLADYGYHVEFLNTRHQGIIDEGLRNVHNDTCYPALLVIGQMIDALKSGKYDLDRTALMITQTGGGCRASNYIHLLRKALATCGFSQVPVVSLNLSGLPGVNTFHYTLPMLLKAGYAVLYGDLMMCVANQCRPYEVRKGDTQKVLDKWIEKIGKQFRGKGFLALQKNYRAILADFAQIPRKQTARIKVGIVGEIYMKYSPLGNSALEEFLVGEGAEPVVSGLLDFLLYCFTNNEVDYKLYGMKKWSWRPAMWLSRFLMHEQQKIIRVIEQQGVFTPPTSFQSLLELVDGTISRGAKMGEGWLLTAEMLEHIHSGVNNIVCAQPFGCLPNHIVAKGMIRKIKDTYPKANIVAIDYDPSATRINQENRLKLMLANARMAEDGGDAVGQDAAYQPHVTSGVAATADA